MQVQQFSFGKGNFLIEASFVKVGDDCVVAIGGGEKQHIGAVAVGVPRPSLKKDGTNSSSASVICLTGHKEDMLARTAALELSKALGHTVTVTVGIHIDNVAPDAIGIVESHFRFLVEQIIDWAAAKE
ncbi:MAG: hypothetical protein SO119_05620 [Phascolarctobacterium sp.]|nr:hypothetical protein [Phascolarctobacterium sp.]